MRLSPSRILERWDQKYVWHPFTQHTEWAARRPIVIESGRGVWLRDHRGRKFMDGVSSLWVSVFGHCRKELNQALHRQAARVAHSTFLGLTHEPAIRLAKKLVEIAPAGLSRVFYSDNGSTAVEVAVKMAYQYWQLQGHPKKKKFVSLKEGYHGDTLGSVSVGGIDLFHSRFEGLLFKGYSVRPPSPAYGEGDIERVLARHHSSIAAVVMEPLIQGAAGMRVMPQGYLARVSRLCKKYQVLLIVDEVATGFGRTGTMFAVEQEKVAPDFLCVAKSLTGGYLPLAATLTREKIYRSFLGRYDEFKTFFHGHTYTANPLACAVALANLNLYEKENLLRNVRERSRQMAQALASLADHPHVKEVRQVGLMAGIELVAKKETSLTRAGAALSLGERVGVRHQPYPSGLRMGLKVCDAAFRRGVWLRPLGDVVVLMPPLVINARELSFLVRVFRESIDHATICP